MEQINLFEVLYEKYHIKNKIRLIELFGGIGSQAKALEVLEEQGKLPMGFEHYRLVEFDKYPVASYNAIHHTNFEPTDITKINAKDLGIRDRDKYDYLMTYSFPCQDLSIGNKNAKGLKGKRSGLLYEVERLLNECGDELPQVLMMENVFTIVGDKFIDDFKAWQSFLESKGYSNYYEILNAKDYGMPQNRSRCFMVSILGNAYYEFPKPIPLKTRLQDYLENFVDGKYIASDKKIAYLEKKVKQGYKKQIVTSPEGIATCVCNPSRNQINDTYVYCVEVDKKYYLSKKMIDCMANENTKGFNRAERFYQTLVNTNINGIASTITTCAGSRPTDNFIIEEDFNQDNFKEKKIRRLTPKECWRLMGWSNDEDFERAAKVNSNAQLYKQAGNSIVVNCLVAIFSQLL